MEGKKIVFVSDAHLGLDMDSAREREVRFLAFLRGIDAAQVGKLFLLGDIWDFWYEYRDVVPRFAARVVNALMNLMDAGVEVWFCPGNHDIWTYSYFESLGMKRFDQPAIFELEGKTFCLGHGDTLGGSGHWGIRLMLWTFRCRFFQILFGTLHPWIGYRLGILWSCSNRNNKKVYHFRGSEEPLYKFCAEMEKEHKIDYFVFGHFHDQVELDLPRGGKLMLLSDWMAGGMPCGVFSGGEFRFHSQGCGA